MTKDVIFLQCTSGGVGVKLFSSVLSLYPYCVYCENAKS